MRCRAARSQPLVIDVVEGGDYVLRVQPPLGATADFDVAIEASALLAFPVEGVDGSAIWSGFGAERDGGRRAHRGVDIFAARGTPVLAATDGWVTRVETTRVGGNVVWMQPLFGNMRVYYAHLHEQWVEPGDFVLAGQPLGAVGNTGNADHDAAAPALRRLRAPTGRARRRARSRRIFAVTRNPFVAGSRCALARLGS